MTKIRKMTRIKMMEVRMRKLKMRWMKMRMTKMKMKIMQKILKTMRNCKRTIKKKRIKSRYLLMKSCSRMMMTGIQSGGHKQKKS